MAERLESVEVLRARQPAALAQRTCRPPLDEVLRAVHQAILRGFGVNGRPPRRSDLEPVTGRFSASATDVLRDLAASDLIGVDSAGEIVVAYPFSTVPTAHPVRLANEIVVWSMCAIDALGIPPMLNTDAVVSSAEPGTNEPIRVMFTDGETHWDPPSAVVFVGSVDVAGPSSATCCGDLNFFTTREAALGWHAAHPEISGVVLDQAQAERCGGTSSAPCSPARKGTVMAGTTDAIWSVVTVRHVVGVGL